MVKIRLQLKGKKKQAYYHIVAMDSRDRRSGKVLDLLGSYDPHKEKNADKIQINTEKYQSWLAKGAQASNTVVQILRSSSI